jgi:DNA-3-methyladenine glycosylase I
MEKHTSYCDYVSKLPKDNIHRIYHDTQYGVLVENDNELFGRLILEINQAGLSWDTILKKQNNFRKAYTNFNIVKIANYNKKDVDRLLNDSGVVRHKLKIESIIYNANKILELQKEYNSFHNWLELNKVISTENWIKLFKKNFKFTGKEITKEFLISTGYILGAHKVDCPYFKL